MATDVTAEADVRLTPKAAMPDFAAGWIQLRLAQFQKELPRALHHPGNPDAIHDLRVSIRRLLACFKIFHGFIEESWVKKSRKVLKKLMRRCAAIRDCDIAIELLGESGTAGKKSIPSLDRQRQTAQRELQEKLRRWKSLGRFTKWAPDLRKSAGAKSTAKDPSGEPAWRLKQSASANARRVLPNLSKAWFASGRAAMTQGQTYDTMHQFRLSTKRFRYILELFELCYTAEPNKKWDRARKLMRGLQDKLGELNDCVASLSLVEDEPAAVRWLEVLSSRREVILRRYWNRLFTAREAHQWQLLLRA